jgi:hypothetical protein
MQEPARAHAAGADVCTDAGHSGIEKHAQTHVPPSSVVGHEQPSGTPLEQDESPELPPSPGGQGFAAEQPLAGDDSLSGVDASVDASRLGLPLALPAQASEPKAAANKGAASAMRPTTALMVPPMQARHAPMGLSPGSRQRHSSSTGQRVPASDPQVAPSVAETASAINNRPGNLPRAGHPVTSTDVGLPGKLGSERSRPARAAVTVASHPVASPEHSSTRRCDRRARVADAGRPASVEPEMGTRPAARGRVVSRGSELRARENERPFSDECAGRTRERASLSRP